MCGGHEVVEMAESMLMPCGFYRNRAPDGVPLLSKMEGWDSLPAVRNDRVVISSLIG